MNCSTLPAKASYLGDGLYVHHDGLQFWLLAYNGITVSSQVAINLDTLDLFFRHVEHVLDVKITMNNSTDPRRNTEDGN